MPIDAGVVDVFVISGSMREKTRPMNASVDIMRKIAEKSYSAIIGSASSGEINSATPEDVVYTYVELITDSSLFACKALKSVLG